MKFFFIFIAAIFFATQILPIKYVKFLCTKSTVSQNQTDDCDTDEDDDDNDNEIKEKSQKEIKFYKENCFTTLRITKLKNIQHFHFNISVKNNHISVVPTPPPNC